MTPRTAEEADDAWTEFGAAGPPVWAADDTPTFAIPPCKPCKGIGWVRPTLEPMKRCPSCDGMGIQVLRF